jgi:hypothetical protein
MSPKAKATRQIGSRTKSAKKTAEQTPATARRTTRSNPATAATAAEPSRQTRKKSATPAAAAKGHVAKKTLLPEILSSSDDEDIPIAAAAAAAAIAALKGSDTSNGAGPSKPPPSKKTAVSTDARRKSTRTPAKPRPAANSLLPLEVALKKWNELPEKKRTPAEAIIITADACRRAAKLSGKALYTGSVKISKETPQISQTVLELYRTMRARCGTYISEHAMIQNMSAEYATNLSWVKGSISLVTGKYVGMEFSAAYESVVSSVTAPTGPLVDLMYNCFKLNLCTYQEVKEFVAKKILWKGARAYLLPDMEVLKLVRSGTHEKFKANHIITTCGIVQECVKFVDTMFEDVKHIKWVDAQHLAPATATEEQHEDYYAGDGDIDTDDDEFEKDEGEDSYMN